MRKEDLEFHEQLLKLRSMQKRRKNNYLRHLDVLGDRNVTLTLSRKERRVIAQLLEYSPGMPAKVAR